MAIYVSFKIKFLNSKQGIMLAIHKTSTMMSEVDPRPNFYLHCIRNIFHIHVMFLIELQKQLLDNYKEIQ